MDAPITDEQYKEIDGAVKLSARQAMIGRRLMPIYGPLGFGKQSVTFDVVTEVGDAEVNFAWRPGASEDIVNLTRTTKAIPVIQKAFRINARSLASSRTVGTPIDTVTARSAAYKVAKQEDAIILDGYAADGSNYDVDGLYQAAGNTEGTAEDFGTATNGVAKMGLAMAVMRTDSIFPPYNVVLHPTQYGEIVNHVLTNTAVLERVVMEQQIGGGVILESPSLTAATGLMLAAGDRGYFDLAVGVDITTEVEELSLREGRDLFGVVYECLVPRIWETNGVCTLTSI